MIKSLQLLTPECHLRKAAYSDVYVHDIIIM